MEIDKYDEQIINELIDNSKTPLRKLATQLKISFVTVMNRIKKLEKEEIIKQYEAKIDYEKLGYGVNALIEIKIAKGKLFELENKIAKNPAVYSVYDTTGEYDTTVFARFKSTRTMDTFLKKIQTFDFVERTNTKLILNVIREKQIRL